METPNLKCFQNIQNILLLSYGHFLTKREPSHLKVFKTFKISLHLFTDILWLKISPLNKTFYRLKISLTYTHRETVNAHPVFDKFLEYLHSPLLSYGLFFMKTELWIHIFLFFWKWQMKIHSITLSKKGHKKYPSRMN